MKRNFKMPTIVLIILSALFLLIKSPAYIIAKSTGYKALKAFAYYKTTEFSKSVDSYETKNFIVNNLGAEDDVVEKLIGLLEKSYNLIGNEFGYFPSKRTPVYIYGSLEEFYEQNRYFSGEKIMGLYHLGVIHIIVPEVFGMDFYEFEKNGPVLHEYTHKVVDELTDGNLEIWFTEGMALFQEYKQYGNEWGKGLEFDNMYSMRDLRKNFLSLDSVQAYRQSFQIIKNIYDEHGEEKVLELLSLLKKGSNMDKALNEVFYGDMVTRKKGFIPFG